MIKVALADIRDDDEIEEAVEALLEALELFRKSIEEKASDEQA